METSEPYLSAVRVLHSSAVPCSLVPFRLSDNKPTSIQDEDEDVAAERQRVYSGGSKTDILQIRDLSKVKISDVMFVTSPRVLLY